MTKPRSYINPIYRDVSRYYFSVLTRSPQVEVMFQKTRKYVYLRGPLVWQAVQMWLLQVSLMLLSTCDKTLIVVTLLL